MQVAVLPVLSAFDRPARAYNAPQPWQGDNITRAYINITRADINITRSYI